MWVLPAVDDGLLVPVLKFTDEMSLTQISANVRHIAEKAKDKNGNNEIEVALTISNLGMFGIQEFLHY